jgi:small redox-active disulfide protein 2
MEIKILGPGSLNDQKMEEMVKVAVKELGVEATLVKISDIGEIVRYGIVATPGLIVNGKVKHSGKTVPDMDRIKDLIKSEL